LEDRVTPSTGGLLDPTFGSGGQVLSSFTNNVDTAEAVTVQPDGKIVTAGGTVVSGSKTGADFLVARYNVDGSLDTGFGSGGHTATDFGSPVDGAKAVALQPQAGGPAKILAAGGTRSHQGIDEFALARYNADGTLDTTFGTKGKVITELAGGKSGGVGAMAVDGSGRIVVAGEADGVTPTLVRYTPNGALDTSFGTGGMLLTNISAINSPVKVVLQPDGKIVLACSPTNTPEFITARFNANGTADTTFGTGGVVATHVGGSDVAGGVTIDGAGRILVAGWDDGIQINGDYLLRYAANGALDSSFGSGGVATLVNPAGWSSLVDARIVAGVAVQANGQIVVGGNLSNMQQGGLEYEVAVWANPDGTLDTDYGSGGWASTVIGGGGEARAMALQPDGLLLAGYVTTAGFNPTDLTLARFLGGPQIGSFTVSSNPASAGSSVTLTASNILDGDPNPTVTQVAFYVEVNGTNTLLGYGTQTSPGVWTFPWSTAGLTAGTYTLYAQAQDGYGLLSDPDALALTVQ
jgi:uncharacterized delta-60 repeat protein